MLKDWLENLGESIRGCVDERPRLVAGQRPEQSEPAAR
jgi:hypothetical protein